MRHVRFSFPHFPSLARAKAAPLAAKAESENPTELRWSATMALSELLRATRQAEDLDAAKALAGIFNADSVMRKTIGRPDEYEAQDILRLAEIIMSYAPKGLPKVSQLNTAIRAQNEGAQQNSRDTAVAAVNAVEQSLATEG